MAFCSHCGTKLEDGAKFCAGCGMKTEAGAPPPAQGYQQGVSQGAQKTPWQYFANAIEKYTVFSGRARRAEFWGYMLFYVIVIIAAVLADFILNVMSFKFFGLPSTYPHLYYYTATAVFTLPTIAAYIRRMHDCDKSGWYFLIPIYGWIVLPCTAGHIGPNRFGPDPKQTN
jgi:uncharacterized membrane protein YhaH (DUF805 family)